MGSSELHVAARRGAHAVLAKSVSQVQKAAQEVEAIKQGVSVKDIAGLSRTVALIHSFPVRMKLVLTRPIINPHAERVFLFASASVYAHLTRSDLDGAGRPLWAKQMPLLYHPSKDLLKSSLGESLSRLSALVAQKIHKHDKNGNSLHAAAAELIVSFFVHSVVKNESEWTDDERMDASTAAAPLMQLIWLSTALASVYRKLAVSLSTVIDDHFTARISPYRGLALSKPEWSVLNSPIANSFGSIGIHVSIPADRQDEIQTAKFEDFITELFIANSAVCVYESVTTLCYQLIRKFNSRHLKATVSRGSSNETPTGVSFQSMLIRPWSDDADVRAIRNVYAFIATVVKSETAMTVVFANVLTGIWNAIAQNPTIAETCQSAQQGPTTVSLESDRWLRQDVHRLIFSSRASVSPHLAKFLESVSVHKRDAAVVRIQSYWRGARLRKSKPLRQVAEYIQNTNWPDLALMDFLDDEPDFSASPVPSNSNSTLTRASLMRLAPKSVGHDRPTTPSSSVVTKQTNGVSNIGESGNVPDLIQADHIACAKLVFILSWSVLLRRRMERVFAAIVAAIDIVSVKFGELIEKNPLYAEAMLSASAELRKTAVKRIVKTALPKVQAKPVSLIDKLGKEIRDEFLSRKIVFTAGKKPHATKKIEQQNKSIDSARREIVPKYMEEYCRLSDGDDSIFRDITGAVGESLTVPADWTPIWLPIRATRFASARARLVSALRSDKTKAAFYQAEENLEFPQCITILGDTSKGNLDIFSTSNAQPFFVECVFHLSVGYAAQCIKANKPDVGMALLTKVVNCFSTALKKLQSDHQLAIEAMILDSAIGFAHAFPRAAKDHMEAWYAGATDRYTRLGQINRFARGCLRYASVLSKVNQTSQALTVVNRAIERIDSGKPSPISLLGKVNRAILNASRGHLEAAEVEIREVNRAAKEHETSETASLREMTEALKQRLVNQRETKRGIV